VSAIINELISPFFIEKLV